MGIAVKCGKGYRVGEDKAGKKMRCKECDGVVAIPQPNTERDDEWDDFGDNYGEAEAAPRPKSGAKSQGNASGKTRGAGRRKKPAKSRGNSRKKNTKHVGGLAVVGSSVLSMSHEALALFFVARASLRYCGALLVSSNVHFEAP